MYRFVVLLIIVILFLWIVSLIRKSPTPAYRVWRNAVICPSLTELREACGHEPLRVENYTGQLDPDLSVAYHPLQYWFEDLHLKRGKLSKLAFDTTTDRPVGKWLLQWWREQSLPVAIQERLQGATGVRYLARLSNGAWHFPNHFDCVDNFAVVIAGTRKVRLNREDPPLTLQAGDVLYIPSELEHEFWCDTADDELNILFTVNLTPLNLDAANRCSVRFASLYPHQQHRLNTKFEYT